MAGNPYVNKVMYGGNTLIDLTQDEAERADVIDGASFHLYTGEQVTGTMPNVGAEIVTLDSLASENISQGYHAAGGYARIAPAERAKCIPANIKSGITLLGIAGTLVAGDANFVRGTFTTTSTENSVQEVAIPYSGTGYPVAVLLMPTGGPYNSSSAQYNTIRQYAIMFAAMVKSNWASTPNYASTGVRNYGTSLYFYKSSSSSATSYAQSSGYNQTLYNGVTAPTGTNRLALKWKDATTLWLYVSAAGTYGFWPDVEYTYYVVYSE